MEKGADGSERQAGAGTEEAPHDPAAARFVFLLEDGFTMQAFSSGIEVLRVARKLGGGDAYRYAVAALEPGPAPASNGVCVLAEAAIRDAPPTATVLVVSGAGAATRPNPPLIAQLRRLRRAGNPIWGVSSGVVRMAQAGLFAAPDDRGRRPRVAAHWEDAPYLRARFPELALSPSLFEWGPAIASCAGGGAAADLMLDHVRRTGDAALVSEIAARLMMDGVRDGRMAQTQALELALPTTSGAAHRALQAMRDTVFAPLRIADIAARSGVTQRQLERVFHREFNASPLRVYRRLRLEGARQEVLAGRRPLGEIALDYGFSMDRFARAYRELYGAAPRDDRRRSEPARMKASAAES